MNIKIFFTCEVTDQSFFLLYVVSFHIKYKHAVESTPKAKFHLIREKSFLKSFEVTDSMCNVSYIYNEQNMNIVFC